MRIDQRAPTFGPGVVQPRAREVGGGRFSLGAEKAAGSAAARSAAPLATLDAILALQAEENPADRRRRSASRGKALLDGLDALKVSILSGRVPPDALSRIASGLRGDPSGDPALDAVVAAIELRAKVELAKLGRYDQI